MICWRRWFIFVILLYMAAVIVLSRRPEFSLAETLIELAIFGFAFPLIAWLTTRRAKRLELDVDPTGTEMLVLAVYILALSRLVHRRSIHGCQEIGWRRGASDFLLH